MLHRNCSSTAHTNRAASINSYGVGLVCALAQLQRRQQAEGEKQLRDVSRKMHGKEYSGFYLEVQPEPE